MPSSYVLGQVQHGGARYVQETHMDIYGKVIVCEYLAPDGADYGAILSARAIALEAAEKSNEIERNISAIMGEGSLAKTVFRYSTKAENVGPLRDAFRSSNRDVSIMVADYLATLTDAQLRAIFSRTQAEVDTLRANRLIPAIDLANSLRAAEGE